MQECIFDPVQPIFMSLTAQNTYKFSGFPGWELGVVCSALWCRCNKAGRTDVSGKKNMLLLCSGPDWSIFHLRPPLTATDTRKPHFHT